MSSIRLVTQTPYDDHAIRFLLAEKNQKYTVHTPTSPEIKLLANWIDHHQDFPLLIDSDLCLYSPTVILEYLDDRYPLPALMPLDPGTKARTRLIIKQLIQKWRDAKNNDTETHRQLNALNIYLAEEKFILGDTFSLADIVIMPILHSLRPEHRNVISQLKNLDRYARRIAERKSFRHSLLSYPRQDDFLTQTA